MKNHHYFAEHHYNVYYGKIAAFAFFCYVTLCYICFSEPWSAGVTKLFMTAIFISAAVFINTVYKFGGTSSEKDTDDKDLYSELQPQRT